MVAQKADIASKNTIFVRILLTVILFSIMWKYEIVNYLKSIFFYAWRMGHEMALNLLGEQDLGAFEISSTGNYITIFVSYGIILYGSVLVAVLISNLISFTEKESKNIA